MPRRKKIDNLDSLREVVNDCINTNNTEFLIQLLHRLQTEYNEIAKLSTLGNYREGWSHKKVLDYITKEI
jgi:flagellar biosynthesis/type III secretory pathway ATPase